MKRFIAHLACIVFCSPVQAIDLEQTINLALENHPSIQSKRLELVAASENVKGSLWQMGPGITYTKEKDSYGQDSKTTRIQQPLFVGGRLFGTLKENAAKRDVTESELAATQQDLISKVAETYIDLVRLNKNKDIALANEREHKRLLEMIQRRSSTGLSSDNDVVLASMRYQQALSEYEQTMTQADTQRITLEELISHPIPPNENIKPLLDSKLEMPSLEEAKILTSNFYPQILIQRNKASAAEAHISVERSALLPQIYLRNEKYQGYVGLGNPYSGTKTYVAIEYQFGSGISSAYSWNAAVNQFHSAEAAIETTEKEVANILKREWNQYQLSKNQLKIIKLQADNSIEVRESFLRQYTIGKRNWLEVLNAQKEMAQTKYTLTDTEANFYRSQIRIGLLTGLLQPNNLAPLKDQ